MCGIRNNAQSLKALIVQKNKQNSSQAMLIYHTIGMC